ncbi:MAG: UDP-3-O-(3-hydroxymyristoyl)glucosamine N-acyltransferase, partial [Candidatus Methylomirabilis sp.]|nr:UDP-3-O-(3-hydroxymyristoyl)glucosamine N-acyltransferase [Deltaproteobacteria bacterium]
AADAALFPFAFVGPRAEIGPRTALYPGVYVGEDARVGADCVLYPNVVIGRGCEVGDRVTLHPGVSVGADGFGFAKLGARYVKIPQVGRAVIEDDVEIGANSCVDRATMGVTRVRRGVKMDDLVMVGHNCDVGEDTAIVSQAGVCGSTKIGKECAIGPQVGVLGHLEIGDGVQVVGQSAVRESLEGPGAYGGTPTLAYAEWRRNVMASTKVAEMRRRLQRLEREVRALRAAAGLGSDSEEGEEA